MNARIKALADEFRAHLAKAQEIAEAAEKDGDRDFTPDEQAQVKQYVEKAQEVKKRLDAAKADGAIRSAIADLGDGVGLADDDEDADGRRKAAAKSGLWTPGKGAKSLGKHFTESPQFKALLDQQGPGGFAKAQRVRTDPVGYKALVTSGGENSADVLVNPDQRGLLVGQELFYRPLTLRSLVTNGTTTSDQIEYARITGWTNNAAPVPEATSAAAGATVVAGGYKPESGFSTARVTTPVRTIAHWMPITKRALSDAAQVRTIIDNFLSQGLEEELEDQMIAGDGTGENFEGLNSVSGTQSQTAVADPAGRPAGFGNLLAIRRAKTKVRLVGRSVANGVAIHPNDLETLDEVATSTDQFYFGGPSGSNNTNPLWGMSVIESEAVPEGSAWVGDWRKAILWDREQASIVATDTHADFFVRNLVAILAEMRAAFGVIQPSAFVKVALNA